MAIPLEQFKNRTGSKSQKRKAVNAPKQGTNGVWKRQVGAGTRAQFTQGRCRSRARSGKDSTKRTKSTRRLIPSLRCMRFRCVRTELAARPD